jgi:twitching motility protein PilT
MAAIDAIFPLVIERGASDLHISPGRPPLIRVAEGLLPLEGDDLTPEMSRKFLTEMMTPTQAAFFEEQKEIDFAYEVPGLVRLRCNLFEQVHGMAGVFRLVPSEVPDANSLRLPQDIMRFCDLPRGLVVVTGATGSGKSTTLAAMIDVINTRHNRHILTIEDPVEFVHVNKKSLINQREVGSNTLSFSAALRSALREDPDIILVGEMRDLETMRLAITAAETGHLVFGTLHTNSAAGSVDRIVDAFPADEQAQIRVMLAESLKGVIAQRLLPTADGSGRAGVFEVLVNTTAMATVIREARTHQIPGMMQTGRREGMVTLDQSLQALVDEGRIASSEAARHANNPNAFKQNVWEQDPTPA